MAEVSFFFHPSPGLAGPAHLRRILEKEHGVAAVSLDPTNSRVTISYDPHLIDTFGLAEALREAGYALVTATTTLSVTGMTCASCLFHVESALMDIPGVVGAEVDLQSGTAVVTVVNEGVDWQALRQAIEEAGYQASVLIPAQ